MADLGIRSYHTSHSQPLSLAAYPSLRSAALRLPAPVPLARHQSSNWYLYPARQHIPYPLLLKWLSPKNMPAIWLCIGDIISYSAIIFNYPLWLNITTGQIIARCIHAMHPFPLGGVIVRLLSRQLVNQWNEYRWHWLNGCWMLFSGYLWLTVLKSE